MPVAKLTACSTPDAMKSEERNDSLDNFIRQAIGKDPFLSFSRAGDSPVQWIQLLHALDQQGTSKFSNGPKINNPIEGRERSLEYCNGLSSYASEVNGVKESVHHIKSGGLPVKGAKNDSEHMQSLKIPEAVVAFAQAAAKANGEPEKYLPGWPLLSPLKVQMQKCDKCSREFCSPINYRRHIRVHRRSWNLDKDSALNRDLLGAFWDKLSPDEAKEIVSFNDVTLEEVPGSSIIRALTAFIRKPGFSSLPQVCVRAGSALLDIFQARPSRFPISSQELFSVLDDASEKTFLCGTALSIQKYVFDGEAGKIGLEMKNLVACTSFLVEQKLIKAWLADKDAEALRCQKLLVEEEEAAQRRQAMLLARKRQKKLRQKEQKAKEQTNGESTDFKEAYVDSLEGVPSAETSSPLVAFDSNSPTASTLPDHVLSSLELIQLSNNEEDVDTEAQSGYGSGYSDTGTCQNVEPRMVPGTGRRHLVVARWQVPKSQMGVRNGFHATQNPQVLKLGAVQKHGTHRDQRAAPVVNGNKVWTRKPKSEIDGESLKNRLQNDAINQPDQNKNSEVLIGSISVTLGNCSGQQQGDSLAGARDNCAADHSMPKKNNVQEKPGKPDSAHLGTNRSTVKLWRPVSRHETRGPIPVQSGNRESEVDMITGRGNERTLSSESCLTSCAMDDNCSGSGNNSHSLLEESARPGVLLFSSRVAEAFLTQRWKEAIAADHVKLVLSPESEPPGCPEIQNDSQVAAPTSDFQKRSVLGNAENWLANVGALESSTTGTAKAKFRTKTEKGVKLKYIPKQRTIT